MTTILGPPDTEACIRPARRADAAAVSRLYFDTVHQVNARDYAPAQIEAWAPRVYDDHFWLRRFKRYHVFVAVDRAEIVGFAELGADGHVDCFYVHHGRQRRGVGSMLMRRLIAEARKRRFPRLFADVSLTAKPFFRRMGFKVRRRRKKIYRRRAFAQFLMDLPVRRVKGIPGSRNGTAWRSVFFVENQMKSVRYYSPQGAFNVRGKRIHFEWKVRQTPENTFPAEVEKRIFPTMRKK